MLATRLYETDILSGGQAARSVPRSGEQDLTLSAPVILRCSSIAIRVCSVSPNWTGRRVFLWPGTLLQSTDGRCGTLF